MTSFEQFEANRRNALRSSGPKTDGGKRRSRVNAVRHGLTAEAAIISDYCAETAVARELVLRLASLLWRLRRATSIETDLFEIQAEALRERRLGVALNRTHGAVFRAFEGPICTNEFKQAGKGSGPGCVERATEKHQTDGLDYSRSDPTGTTRQLTHCYLRLANRDAGVFERLNRYEAALWRQTVQALLAVHSVRQRTRTLGLL